MQRVNTWKQNKYFSKMSGEHVVGSINVINFVKFGQKKKGQGFLKKKFEKFAKMLGVLNVQE